MAAHILVSMCIYYIYIYRRDRVRISQGVTDFQYTYRDVRMTLKNFERLNKY